MQEVTSDQISEAISTLLAATRNDSDPISCLVLGALEGGFQEAEGTVFIVRNGDTADALYKYLLLQKHCSNTPAILPHSPEQASLAEQYLACSIYQSECTGRAARWRVLEPQLQAKWLAEARQEIAEWVANEAYHEAERERIKHEAKKGCRL